MEAAFKALVTTAATLALFFLASPSQAQTVTATACANASQFDSFFFDDTMDNTAFIPIPARDGKVIVVVVMNGIANAQPTAIQPLGRLVPVQVGPDNRLEWGGHYPTGTEGTTSESFFPGAFNPSPGTESLVIWGLLEPGMTVRLIVSGCYVTTA